jgi:hypothetical protein
MGLTVLPMTSEVTYVSQAHACPLFKGDPGRAKKVVTLGIVGEAFAEEYLKNNLDKTIREAVIAGNYTMVIYEGPDPSLGQAIFNKLKKDSYPAEINIDRPFKGPASCKVTLSFRPKAEGA